MSGIGMLHWTVFVSAVAFAAEVRAERIKLALVAGGFERPTQVTSAPGDTGRLFVLELITGRVRILRDGVITGTFITVPDVNWVPNGDAGLLGLAFHPSYAENGRFFLSYTAKHDIYPNGKTVIAEYRVSADDPDRAEPDHRILLQFDRPYPLSYSHNGGSLAFGPDGYLYIGLGDGFEAAKSRTPEDTKLGKLLRIDVDGEDAFPEDDSRNYAIPPDNPFVDRPGAEEVWAYGLRNPWRITFDRLTGDLYIADVGDKTHEEINYQPAGEPGGRDYGWDCQEGTHCTETPSVPCECPSSALTEPIYVYDHNRQDNPDFAGCSIIGGHVYRGSQIPELVGRYVFSDFCSGSVWSLKVEAGVAVEVVRLPDIGWSWGNPLVSTLGEGADGELYICNYSKGEVYQFVHMPDEEPPPADPPPTDPPVEDPPPADPPPSDPPVEDPPPDSQPAEPPATQPPADDASPRDGQDNSPVIEPDKTLDSELSIDAPDDDSPGTAQTAPADTTTASGADEQAEDDARPEGSSTCLVCRLCGYGCVPAIACTLVLFFIRRGRPAPRRCFDR